MQTKNKLEVIFTVFLTKRAKIHKTQKISKKKTNRPIKVNKEHE